MTNYAFSDMAENGENYRIDPDRKPPYSYATLICLAMRANNNKLTLSSIYAWIKENFKYYKKADPAWQVNSNPLVPLIIRYHLEAFQAF